jgi:hypothetical protein
MSQTKAQLLENFVTVKDFGAVGDGVANDTAAIQTAINACAGKTIYFPPGTYIVSSQITLISNTSLKGEKGQSVLKLATQTWGVVNGALFGSSLRTNIQLEALVFDGNKGNIGTARNNLIVFFRCQKLAVRDCTFRSVEGICLLASTDIDDIKIQGCQFLECGGNPNNSNGYRKQAIAFDNTAPYRNKNVVIEGCYFYQQGLDCISLADIDNAAVLDNLSADSYSLLYSNPSPYFVTNLVVQGNVVQNCSEFGANTAVPPLAFDLLEVKGLVLTGNSVYGCDTAAIGLFAGTRDALVASNTIVDAMQDSGLRFCAIEIDNVENVTVSGNVIRDTNTPSNTEFGILIKSNAVNLLVANNTIQNVVTSRIGYFINDPFAGTVYPFTNPSQLSATTQVIDADTPARVTREYSRRHILVEDNSNPALTLTQTGTGNCFVVEDSTSPDGTSFVVNNDGNVGIRMSPATFGSALTVSAGGGIPTAHFQRIDNNNNGADLRFLKTRSGNPYDQQIVVNGDVIGAITAFGSDGADYRSFGTILITADGAVSAGSCPGTWRFSTTPSGSMSSIERFRVKSSGQVQFIPQTTPGSAEPGDVYYDSGINKLRCYDGSIWNNLF